MRLTILLIAVFLLPAGCRDPEYPIIDGIYDHPREEDRYEIPDNATPIDFLKAPDLTSKIN